MFKFRFGMLFLLAAHSIGCPDSSEKDNEILGDLDGSWVGELNCYEEGGSSSGIATLEIDSSDKSAIGSIVFVGDSPYEFTTTASLELWEEDGELDGKWSDCEIDSDDSLTCHFWHQEQSSGFIFKPNVWSLSEDGSVFTIGAASNVESEAQKCEGDLNRDE